MTYPSAPRPDQPTLIGRLLAEAAGTFVLVFGLIGTAIFASGPLEGDGTPEPVGILGIALALGISVIIGAYAFGPISGGHFNPAVSVGLATAGKVPWRDVPGYVVAQAVGGFLGATAVVAIAAGAPGDLLTHALDTGFASNGYGDHSPDGFSLVSTLVVEVIGTAVFVFIILGVTNAEAHPEVAPIPIGLTLTLLLLVAIPVDNAGFNPARSLATAVYGGGPALGQLWVFLLAPCVGALVAGFTNRFLFETAGRNRSVVFKNQNA